MAEQIERNGAKFYRHVAESIKDSKSQELLLSLAAMEEEHEKTFAIMRENMLKEGKVATVDPATDPDGQAGLYLQAMVDGTIFDVKADPSALLTGKEKMSDVLQMAIGLEKDSIVFYLGMKQMIPEELGRGEIEDIIKEEMTHIRILSLELKTLGN